MLSHACTAAQKLSPSAAVHAYKTTIPPLMKDCRTADGTFEAASMGKRAHFLALNAVSLHLASVQVSLSALLCGGASL